MSKNEKKPTPRVVTVRMSHDLHKQLSMRMASQVERLSMNGFCVEAIEEKLARDDESR